MSTNPVNTPANNQQHSTLTDETSHLDRDTRAVQPLSTAPVSSDGISSAMTATQIREELVATAAKFLQNAKVQERPFDQRLEFLERKGLNKAEIELAVLRSQSPAFDASFAHRPALATPAAVVPVPTPVPSSWTRLQDFANMLMLLSGAAYAVYHVYKRFIMPALYGGSETGEVSDPLVEVRRSVDELRRSMADVVAGITETQSLIRTQQRQLDDVIRSNSHQRGADEMERMNVIEVKDELKSLKALLLNRKQFPALPMTTPVIPAWQLDSESRAEIKPAFASSDNDSANTCPSLAPSTETNDSAKDKLNITQPEIILQNDTSTSSDHISPAAAADDDDDDDELVSKGLHNNISSATDHRDDIDNDVDNCMTLSVN